MSAKRNLAGAIIADRTHLQGMRKNRTSPKLPNMLAGLGVASWQTIAIRSAMMASGTCSPAEYQRMLHEKAMAGFETSLRLASWPPPSATGLLTPWYRAARANAKRLARKSRG